MWEVGGAVCWPPVPGCPGTAVSHQDSAGSSGGAGIGQVGVGPGPPRTPVDPRGSPAPSHLKGISGVGFSWEGVLSPPRPPGEAQSQVLSHWTGSGILCGQLYQVLPGPHLVQGSLKCCRYGDHAPSSSPRTVGVTSQLPPHLGAAMEGAVLGPGVLGADAPGGGPGGQFWVRMVLDVCWWLLGVRFPQR